MYFGDLLGLLACRDIHSSSKHLAKSLSHILDVFCKLQLPVDQCIVLTLEQGEALWSW